MNVATSKPASSTIQRRWLQFRLRTLLVAVLGVGVASGVYVLLTRSYVVSLTDDNFESVVLQSNRPVLVEFSASWCGPCRDMEPVVERLALETCWWATVGTLDVDTCPETLRQYNVDTVPAFFVFQNGEVVSRPTGSMTKEQLSEHLRNANSG